MNKEDVELKVCPACDAPLPFTPSDKSFFNMNEILCDDCFKLEKKEENCNKKNI